MIADVTSSFSPQPVAPLATTASTDSTARLTAEEWARVIYHLCKHRGFHWISRAEEESREDDAKGEGGRVEKD
ncbi:MAG: hypothetical protein U5L03_04295 [Burkholderiaceae bacterium]|nr:hypothetical protein [Burkholderiaceae bacterium]